MSKQNLTARSQAGFTLVELAIVMIIIGLLIGGVLKGQELIGNAQVTATIAQTKAMDAATTTFRDTYAGVPGDLLTPTTRLPNCTTATPCGNIGDGNGRLSTAPSAASSLTNEAGAFFVQLAAANLVTGIVPDGGDMAFGGNLPSAKIGGSGFRVGSSVAGAVADLGGSTGTANASAGVWLALVNDPATALTATVGQGLKPTEAFRIDTKVDDSSPNTGIVRASGGAGATGCAAGTADTDIYNTSLSGNICGLYIRIQG